MRIWALILSRRATQYNDQVEEKANIRHGVGKGNQEGIITCLGAVELGISNMTLNTGELRQVEVKHTTMYTKNLGLAHEDNFVIDKI